MNNVFILGCGRSGTSLVAGLFKDTGLFMGNQFYKKRESNPFGFFEDRTVNSINEDILKPFLPQRYSYLNTEYGSDIPLDGQRWLARIPTNIDIFADKTQSQSIRNVLHNKPFCLKDPRFCYTLDSWRKEAPNSKFICVFRNPSDVVESILKEVRESQYLFNFSISVNSVFETWKFMYGHVLEKHSKNGEWLFIYYEDLFFSDTLSKIEEFTGIFIDRSLPRLELNRSKSKLTIDSSIQLFYNKLLSLRS